MAKTKLSDGLLINMYISGDESALEILVKRHQSKLYRFIYSKVNDREIADDFFQETFIRVINTFKEQNYYNEKGKFLPWVMRIANNLIVDYYRKKSKVTIFRESEECSVFTFIKDESISVEQYFEKENVATQVKQLINKLPSDQSEVLLLRIFHDLSFKEISELTNVSMNTSLGRMRYAITNLKKLAKKNNISLVL
ncbi:sigma-70 family RNA polymerase sigma factor [Flavobacterium sp.]|jgi:RNA polymerase sigma-70 factor (ECF subfamily)|uniref:RNA polymerase sigma factor n=1 Tax=Flavobacterium sp. TaxID=239 RepID=UPI002BF754ED|nr:sigma-70 family RNA polymerase sigma factor [Flavobacterium sp.]MCA0347724.1 sigma-70 family RNA polymerase sigma factor [Bacteroidota bacterium]HQA74784.1 sigma-70 family RNA polymerase sigma factor [Flavobacterium sp.]